VTFRHAAALAMVGWYLMVPPVLESNKLDTTAPLAIWSILRGFDEASDGESYRDHLVKQVNLNGKKLNWGDLLIIKSRCIASDDPRLIGALYLPSRG